MKKFFEDFWALQKESNRFLKEHWKGYILLSVIISLPYWLFLVYENHKREKDLEERYDHME